MEMKTILQRVDHTILSPQARWEEVKTICDEAIWGEAASVCLPPCYVAQAAEYLKGRIPVCTVVGFPHGNVTSAIKALEAEHALASGAVEIDMVINLGMVKDQRWEELFSELCTMRSVCQGAVVKVIVETCLLTEEEKRKLCRLVSEAKADYIKTSTGFSTGGATVEDVRLFRANLSKDVKIKASGGIRTFEAAQAMVEAGADRLGSSALIPLAKQQTT